MRLDPPDIARQIADIVGDTHLSSEGLGALALDGLAPRWRVSPGTAEEVAAILDLASREKLAVLPRGSGTKFHLGGKPRAMDILLDTCGLNRIVDYDAPNLTVTLEAGVTLGELKNLLAAEGNFLPLDAPFGASTIGGVIATNSSGPKRLIYGSARDVTLGVRAVLPQSGAVRFGGKVMKNVAGYDMTKLMIGSFGTLGVITQVSLRLLPLPEKAKTLVAAFPSLEQAANAVTAVLESQLFPAAVELLNGAAWPEASPGNGGYHLAVALEGFHEAVERQVADLLSLANKQGARDALTLEAEPQERLWSDLRDNTAAMSGRDAQVVRLKIGVPVSRVQDLFRLAEKVAADRHLKCAITSHAGNGILYILFRDSDDARPVPVQAVRDVRSAAEKAGGYAVVEYAPWALKEEAGDWGGPRPEWALMRRLKEQLDPEVVLNPGRFVGGI